MLPVQAVDLAVEEARRSAERGCTAYYLRPNPVAGRNLMRGYFDDVERRRTILLLAIITAYVALVDLIAFEWRIPVGGFEFRFTGYELFSIAALTLILRIFWRKPIPYCLGVSTGMVMALASVFRYGFRILLPGLG